MAGPTGLDPATPSLTGRVSNTPELRSHSWTETTFLCQRHFLPMCCEGLTRVTNLRNG